MGGRWVGAEMPHEFATVQGWAQLRLGALLVGPAQDKRPTKQLLSMHGHRQVKWVTSGTNAAQVKFVPDFAGLPCLLLLYRNQHAVHRCPQPCPYPGGGKSLPSLQGGLWVTTHRG